MSIGSSAIAAAPVAALAQNQDPTTTRPPRRRQTVARADAVQQPEAR